MKRAALTLTVAIAITFAAIGAQARTIAYLEDTENFPNMIVDHSDCKNAYREYLEMSHQLHACDLLAHAQTEYAVQKELADEMKNVGGKKASKAMVQADEAAAAYQEQIKIYDAQCPSKSQQRKIAKKLPKLARDVCMNCKNKWPGGVGPHTGIPCKN